MKKNLMIPVGIIILLIAAYASFQKFWDKDPIEIQFSDNPVHDDIITLSHKFKNRFASLTFY